jgi:hypothetical protein
MGNDFRKQTNGNPEHWLPSRTGLLTIIQTASACLRLKKSFGLLRLGDGEGAILAQDATFMSDDLQACIKTWFGDQEIRSSDLKEFQSLLEDAIRFVDAIGVPRPTQLSRLPRYAAVIDFMPKDIDIDKILWTDAAIHFYLQWSAAIGTLMRMATRVWIIGCRDVAHDLQQVTDSPVGQWLVRGEAQCPGSVVEPHWRSGFERTMQAISSQTKPGDLVLIGAGILGKAYVASAKANGAVALDIGSVIDGWAGIMSRVGRITDDPEFHISHLQHTYTDEEAIKRLREFLAKTNIQDATIACGDSSSNSTLTGRQPQG